MPAGLEPRAQLGVVVQLAVEHDDHLAVLAGQGLMAVLGVDDGQPAVPQGDLRAVVEALAIRAAVDEPSRHRGHDLRVGVAAGRVDAGDPAHAGSVNPGKEGPGGGVQGGMRLRGACLAAVAVAIVAAEPAQATFHLSLIHI